MALASLCTPFSKICPHSLCCLGGNLGTVCTSQVLGAEWLALNLPITFNRVPGGNLNTTPKCSCSSCLTLSGCKVTWEG